MPGFEAGAAKMNRMISTDLRPTRDSWAQDLNLPLSSLRALCLQLLPCHLVRGQTGHLGNFKSTHRGIAVCRLVARSVDGYVAGWLGGSWFRKLMGWLAV